MYFLSSVTTFAELAYKCRYHCELHTNESKMVLNYQQLRLRLSHLSVLVEQYSLLKSFTELFSALRLSEMLLLLLLNCLISIFASTFYKYVIIQEQSTFRSTFVVKKRESQTLSQKCLLYLNTALGQLKNLLKLEHHAGVKNEQMNYGNSSKWI